MCLLLKASLAKMSVSSFLYWWLNNILLPYAMAVEWDGGTLMPKCAKMTFSWVTKNAVFGPLYPGYKIGFEIKRVIKFLFWKSCKIPWMMESSWALKTLWVDQCFGREGKGSINFSGYGMCAVWGWSVYWYSIFNRTVRWITLMCVILRYRLKTLGNMFWSSRRINKTYMGRWIGRGTRWFLVSCRVVFSKTLERNVKNFF